MNAHNAAAHENPITEIIRSEPKKAVTLAILLLTMAGLWLKVFYFSGPQRAPAAIATGGKSTAQPKATAPGAVLSAAYQQLMEWRKQAVPPLRRNLFTVRYDRFPADDSRLAAQTSQNGFWDQVAKSMDFRADQESARRILVENLQKRAMKLRPRAVMTVNGGHTALIDGNLVGEGDLVDGFRILRIGATRIVVERDGVRLEVLSETN